MNVSRIVAMGAMAVAISSGLALPAQAEPHPAAYRVAAARLAQRPALIKPGHWQTPPGPVLVRECYASYPKRSTELLSCLLQPDPRRTDRTVWTLHQHHLNHVNHINRRR